MLFPPPPEINVEQLGRGRGSIAAGVQATSFNIDFEGKGGQARAGSEQNVHFAAEIRKRSGFL